MKQYQIWPCKSKQNSWINFAWMNSCAVIKSRGALKRRADVNTDTVNTPPCFQSRYYHLNCFQLIKEECWSWARLARLGEKMKIWISLGSKPRVRLTKSAKLHVRSDSFPIWLVCILQVITQNVGENDKRCKHRGGSRISLRVLCVWYWLLHWEFEQWAEWQQAQN